MSGFQINFVCRHSSDLSMFLEWWNATKSLPNIWQYFSCLLDNGIAKICKKFNSHDGFLRADKRQGKKLLPNWLDWLSYLACIYSEKATKFSEMSTLLLSYVVPVKSKVEISQNFVALSEYMNFSSKSHHEIPYFCNPLIK